MDEAEVYDLIIIGAGPAGLAASCAAQDAGMAYVVLERRGIVQSFVEHPQQLRYFSPADEIAIAGIPFPVAGGHKPTREDALAYFRGVAASRALNLAPWEEVVDVEALDPTGPGYRIRSRRHTTGDERIRECRYLLVATGTFQNPRRLCAQGADLPKVMARLDDPTPYFASDVLVVGGGNSAATAAMTLADAGARVTLAMRRPPADFQSHLRPFIVRDLKIMADERRLTLLDGVVVQSISPAEVVLARTAYGAPAEYNSERIIVPNDFVFAMIGHTADPRLFRTLGLTLAADGLPEYNVNTAETSRPGVFVAGALCRANIIIESRRSAVAIVERIKAARRLQLDS
ncbi:MAG: NAD(P)-binding domain-containing protein [Capsulimonadaceae bacterium]